VPTAPTAAAGTGSSSSSHTVVAVALVVDVDLQAGAGADQQAIGKASQGGLLTEAFLAASAYGNLRCPACQPVAVGAAQVCGWGVMTVGSRMGPPASCNSNKGLWRF